LLAQVVPEIEEEDLHRSVLRESRQRSGSGPPVPGSWSSRWPAEWCSEQRQASSRAQRASIVIRRPFTVTLLFATWTNRFTSWKKSARLKKFPTNSSSSGTVSRAPLVGAASAPGVAAPPPIGSPPPVEVEVVVSVAAWSAAALVWLDVAAALFAASAAPPGAL